jgi:acetyl-CoA C-acetyltransferase
MPDAFIIAAARTPIGAFRGAFKTLSATDLGGAVVADVLGRSGVDAGAIDEVIMGNVIGAGVGQAPARQAALKGGLPTSVPALTVNKVCGSGLKSVMLASQAIRLGDAKAIIAGGMESMTNAPHLVPGAREGFRLGDGSIVDSMVSDGLTCAFESCHMGMHAEHIAREHNVTREDQDVFSAESQKRAAAAVEAGVFADEMTSVTVKTRKAETVVDADECVRPETTLESLQGLRPVFDRKEGTVTAGNASTLSDGAAAVLVVDEETANASTSAIKAKIVACHTSGTDPKDLFIAPVTAVQGALEKAGLTTDDIDLYEINEAFAAQMVACLRGLKLDESKVNVYGGGISLGHPIGASGARTLVTLLYAMQKNDAKRGVVSLCLGGGNAVAMVVERV